MWIEWKQQMRIAKAVHVSCCGMYVSQSIVEFIVVWMCVYILVLCRTANSMPFAIWTWWNAFYVSNKFSIVRTRLPLPFTRICCQSMAFIVAHTHSFKWNFASRHNVAHNALHWKRRNQRQCKSVWERDENFA